VVLTISTDLPDDDADGEEAARPLSVENAAGKSTGPYWPPFLC